MINKFSNDNVQYKIFAHYEKIIIEREYREKFYQILETVLTSNSLAQGPVTAEFEKMFSELSGMYATSTSSGSGALYAILNYVGVKSYDVIIPTFTCISVPLTVINAGGNVIFADCNKMETETGLPLR
jgi:dTDP-4-amino-4,6-dideoxygalactose transaminase